MSNEITSHNNLEVSSFNFTRTPEEVQKRIVELKDAIEMNDVWIHRGYNAVPEPTSWRRREILEGKLSELLWALGENNEVGDGL